MDNLELDKSNSNGQWYRLNQPENSSLSDYFKIILVRKWLVIACIIAIVVPTTILTLNIAPTYEAEATVIYEEANDTAFLLDMGQSFYSKSAILNLIEQIKSRTLAEQVANSLPRKVIETFRFPKDPPENFVREKFVARTINKSLEVKNVRGADIIRISIQTNNPNAARTIANAYVDHIIAWNLAKNKEEIYNIRNFVEGQLLAFQEKLKEAEENLLEFKEKNDLVALSDASAEMLSNLTEAEVAYNETKAEREALEQRKRFIENKKQELMPSVVVSDSKAAQQLKEELLNLESQYSKLQLLSGRENQARLTAIRDRIDQTKKSLIDELMGSAVRENLVDPLSQMRNLLQELITIEVDLETSRAREHALKKTMDDYSAELEVLPKQELQLARLIRAKEVNDKIHTILLERHEEARITEAGKVGDVSVIDYAELPLNPIKPQKKKIIALALILSLGLGVGLAFFLDSLDNSLKSEQDVEKYLELPVLASIPKISSNGVLQKMGKREDKNGSYVAKLLPQLYAKSHIVEAYRSLQLNFSFLNPDKELKTLLITSAAPGEGKTLTSVNLAHLHAQSGKRTLLIDCDLRRPSVHQALQINQQPGLTNLLVDKSLNIDSYRNLPDADALHENLAVLACGYLPPNPSELLRSNRMEELLVQAQNSYDLIILDAPPIISVMDAIVLGKTVDAVLLVVRSGKISREAALKAKKILTYSKVKIAGTLLNDVDLKNVYGYYKDYYYYSNKKQNKTVSKVANRL